MNQNNVDRYTVVLRKLRRLGVTSVLVLAAAIAGIIFLLPRLSTTGREEVSLFLALLAGIAFCGLMVAIVPSLFYLSARRSERLESQPPKK